MKIWGFFILFITSSFLPAQANDLDKYFIEFAEEKVELSCENCPPYIGQMYVTRPMKIRDIKEKSDIQMKTCQFTLIEPDLIQTAGHCAEAWEHEGWKEEAGGDCSKVFSFFFAKESGIETSVRCQSIESPIDYTVGKSHTNPDSLLIRLNKKIFVPTPKSERVFLGQASGVFEIWGVMPGESIFVKRECQLTEKTVLTPLRTAGLTQSAFITLSCDGDIRPGWSGAGVFYDGKLVGNVSQTFADTGFYAASFGMDEVVVSLQACSPFLDAENQRPESCFTDEATFYNASVEAYSQSLDLENDWQQLVIRRLEEKLPGLYFEYSKTSSHKNFPLKQRAFVLKCISPNFGESHTTNDVVSRVDVELFGLQPKFVKINEHSQVQGLYGVLSPEPSLGGGFSMPLDLKTTPFVLLQEALFLESDDLSLAKKTIPYCLENKK